MKMMLVQKLEYVCLLSALLIAVSIQAAAQDDKGESKENLVLKNRMTAPKTTDFDKSVTLDELLNKMGPNEWSNAKAATIDGYVIQQEREEDGDYHIVLAARPNETNTTKWVIVEVTNLWTKKSKSLSEPRLKDLRGRHIRATGWLYYEPETTGPDPRGTRWELHPVTDITVL